MRKHRSKGSQSTATGLLRAASPFTPRAHCPNLIDVPPWSGSGTGAAASSRAAEPPPSPPRWLRRRVGPVDAHHPTRRRLVRRHPLHGHHWHDVRRSANCGHARRPARDHPHDQDRESFRLAHGHRHWLVGPRPPVRVRRLPHGQGCRRRGVPGGAPHGQRGGSRAGHCAARRGRERLERRRASDGAGRREGGRGRVLWVFRVMPGPLVACGGGVEAQTTRGGGGSRGGWQRLEGATAMCVW